MFDLKKTALLLAALAALGLAAAPAVHAQTTTITVTNGDFETNTTSTDSNSNLGNIPGWPGQTSGITLGGTNYDSGVQRGGQFNRFPASGAGNHYAFVYTGTYIQQDTGFTTIAGDTYTLTGYLGNTGSDFGSLNLFDGTGTTANLLATSGSQSPPVNVLTPFTVTFVAPTSGTDLVIRLIKTNPEGSNAVATATPTSEANFDNISLTQTAAPEPSQTAALGVGLLGLGGLALRARKRSLLS